MLDPYPETAALQYSYSRKRLRTLDSGRRNVSSIMLRHPALEESIWWEILCRCYHGNRHFGCEEAEIAEESGKKKGSNSWWLEFIHALFLGSQAAFDSSSKAPQALKFTQDPNGFEVDSSSAGQS
ncbi:hypothetical protein QQF64_028635 [Cirrhinus molitorella]|uniref:Uncharacterized protein n=1 Tax=Cirrhinus molitorella TaxID=172907 RepID=A0ABR3N765_9TELE